jgi:hypothetical protein
MTNHYFLRKLFFSILASVLFISPVAGEETRLFIPSYEGEEIIKVRQWEEYWAGKQIDSTNVQQVKDFLLAPQVKVLSDPGFMRTDRYWFEVVPYRKAIYSQGQVAMTIKNTPIARLEGDLLADYRNMAGFIFPNPKSGIEAAYNFDMQTRGDSRVEIQEGNTVQPRTGFVKNDATRRTEMSWSGRTYGRPYPCIADNPKDLRKTLFYKFISPVGMIDSGSLEIRYNDVNRIEDQWFWMKQFRKAQRISRAQRGQNIHGTEQLREDTDGWNAHLQLNTYKLLGRKELLLGRHQDTEKIIREKGSGVYNGLQRERIKTFEVEVVSKDPGYTYSKQIWYLDPEQWHILIKLCWDKKGNLWRCNENFYQKQKTVHDEYAYVTAGSMNWDVFGRHASIFLINEVTEIGQNFPKDIFSVFNLQKSAY